MNSHSFHIDSMERPHSEMRAFETKYPCIICMERVRVPVACLRCHSLLCLAHLRRIDDRCPYCRLAPFAYEQERFTEQLVELDRRKEEEFLVETAEFACLVEGCGFRGKYHKMDLHRRKHHRDETLREILFPYAREDGRRRRAVELLLTRMRDRAELQARSLQLSLILHNRSRGRVPLAQLGEMIAHVDGCGHRQCRRVHAEEAVCFIGSADKEISACPVAQRLLVFYGPA